jgi:hypothetical protein
MVLTILAGLLVAYVGLAVYVSGSDAFVGGVVLVLGGWLAVAAPVVHDRAHRDNGEPSHALWGKDDRRKPPWWPSR